MVNASYLTSSSPVQHI